MQLWETWLLWGRHSGPFTSQASLIYDWEWGLGVHASQRALLCVSVYICVHTYGVARLAGQDSSGFCLPGAGLVGVHCTMSDVFMRVPGTELHKSFLHDQLPAPTSRCCSLVTLSHLLSGASSCGARMLVHVMWS